MIYIGCPVIVIAVIWLFYKMHLSYHSAGGTNLMDPIYDAAVYPPILMAVGLYLVLGALGYDWPYWYYIGIWALAAALFAGLLKGCMAMGDKPL